MIILFILNYQRGNRASPCITSMTKPSSNIITNHNSTTTPLSAPPPPTTTTTCVSTITNTITTANTMPHRDVVSCSIVGRINNNNSPRGHSPNRERDSYR